MGQEKSLDDLLVDEDVLNEELLTEILEKYIRIGKEGGNLYPKPDFKELNSKQKAALILLAQHARHRLGLAETEWLGPTEIAEMSGVKKGTIYPAVRKLEEENLVDNDEGSYRVLPPKLHDVQEYIEGGEST